jgi:polysaccharide biosynthesis/export protein
VELQRIRITVQIGAVSLLLGLTGRLCAAQDSQRFSSDPETQHSAAQVRPIEPGKERPALQRRDWRYRILPGDVLEVDFVLTPEFDQVINVQPDGYVTLKGLGSLRAQGQTTAEFTQALVAAYGKILRDPIITVNLNDFVKPYFIVDGQVDKPGKFELRGETTVTEAVAMAGGFKDSAKHSQVVLFRKVSDQWAEVKVLNVKHMENTRNLAEDVYLRPGDMLFVPKNAISKIKPFIPIPSLGTYFNLGQYLP